MHFHDHMRGRGTSLNFADLASDPPPQSLQVRDPCCTHRPVACAEHPISTLDGVGTSHPATSCMLNLKRRLGVGMQAAYMVCHAVSAERPPCF